MGHLGARNLLKLAEVSTGMDLKRKRGDNKGNDKDVYCSHYAVSKLSARPHQGYLKPGEAPLNLIHTDLSGTINPRGYNGESCYATFRNNKTIMSEVHPLIYKSDVVTRFKEFKARHKRPPDRKIRRLRADGGGEYNSQVFQNYLKLCGITFKPTSRKSPKQNPINKRFNRDIGKKARVIRLSSGIADAFWPELVQTLNYISMRSLSSRLGNITPYEA